VESGGADRVSRCSTHPVLAQCNFARIAAWALSGLRSISCATFSHCRAVLVKPRWCDGSAISDAHSTHCIANRRQVYWFMQLPRRQG